MPPMVNQFLALIAGAVARFVDCSRQFGARVRPPDFDRSHVQRPLFRAGSLPASGTAAKELHRALALISEWGKLCKMR